MLMHPWNPVWVAMTHGIHITMDDSPCELSRKTYCLRRNPLFSYVPHRTSPLPPFIYSTAFSHGSVPHPIPTPVPSKYSMLLPVNVSLLDVWATQSRGHSGAVCKSGLNNPNISMATQELLNAWRCIYVVLRVIVTKVRNKCWNKWTQRSPFQEVEGHAARYEISPLLCAYVKVELTDWKSSLVETTVVTQLVQNLRIFNQNRIFIVVLARVLHRFLSRPIWIQFSKERVVE